MTNILSWGRAKDGQTGLDLPEPSTTEGQQRIREKLHYVYNTEQDNPSVLSPAFVTDINHTNMKNQSSDTTGENNDSHPSPVRSLKSQITFTEISCGSRHTLALDNEGTGWSWGWGLCGQLGHGVNQSLSKPTQIQALRKNKENTTFPGLTCISAGGMHSAAVDRGNVLFYLYLYLSLSLSIYIYIYMYR